MEIVVSFPGGKRVDAQAGSFTIRTDQPVEDGGEASAPSPFALFLASLGTCAGLYVLGFCKTRGIPTDGIRLVQRSESDDKGRVTKITIEVCVPPEFPERYREGVAHAAAACKVKKTIANPPAFEVITIAAAAASAEDSRAAS